MATQPAHTPAPWLRTGRTVYALDQSGAVNRFSVLLNDGYEVCTDFQKRRISEAEQDANARLIEAAPDLVDVLETIPVDAEFANAELFRAAINAWWDGEVRPVLAKARGQ